ncbi:MAG TPA: HPr(Ser) kinase/phosphatase [Candidatus Mcinerneyibacteriales bacterium]|nr:HPr(Ser) kinase/phosphatase [Candidatus Mcinerneyibacteriales bacterium]
MDKKVTVRDLYRELEKNNLPFEFRGEMEWLDRSISSPIFVSPGIALAGYWDYFPEERLIILTKREVAYFNSLTREKKEEVLNRFLDVRALAFIIQHSVHCDGDLEDFARSHEIPIFLFSLPYQELQFSLLDILEDLFARETLMHGCFVDVAEQGILIIGESGIGKSECALELVRRGYRLVADDSILVRRIKNRLFGESREMGRHYIEIRGVGIIDIKELYGLKAVTEEKKIDCVVNLVLFDKKKHFERLGIDRERYRLLGIDLPMYTVPVTPGKSISTVIEVIAKNEYAKKRGYDTPMKLATSMIKQIRGKTRQNHEDQ